MAHKIDENDMRSPDGLLGLMGSLDDEQRLVVETARRWVDDRVRPEIAEWFDTGYVPVRELAKELGALGLLGMHLEGYDCAGSDATTYGLVCREMEAGDSGIRSLVSVQGSLAMFAIRAFGSEEQRTEWLPRMAAGEAIGCFGLTEADSGSDPGSMRTHARRDGDDWILDGSKMWITNGSVADVAVVWAKTDDGIRGFVVPTDTQGFGARDVPRKLSLRASVTSELVFDGVRLPGDAVLPGVVGLKGPLSCLSEARFGIIFGATGAARDSVEAATAYALERVQFDQPIASFQITQAKLAQMTTAVAAATTLAIHLGKLKDTVGIRPEQVSLGKAQTVKSSIEVARTARTILGANGVTVDYSPIRHAANLESVLTYEGTQEIHELVIGHALTGIAAFR